MAEQHDPPVMLPEVSMTLNPGDDCLDCASRSRLRSGLERYGVIPLKDYGNRLWCRSCLRFQT